jgi:hypothetical protein
VEPRAGHKKFKIMDRTWMVRTFDTRMGTSPMEGVSKDDQQISRLNRLKISRLVSLVGAYDINVMSWKA